MKNDDFNEEDFEEILRGRLSPTQPHWDSNRAIFEAILLKDKETIARRKRRSLIQYSWLSSFGVVAILALTFVFFFQANDGFSPKETVTEAISNPVSTVNYRAVGSTEKLLGMEDRGWGDVVDDKVSREYKYEFMDTVDLVNEEDGSIVRLQVPREEIVSVTYQVI